jgi:hypothetical protein
MARKREIKQDEFLAWDQFDNKPPAEALAALYNHATEFSTRCRTWYWTSIRHKRIVSTTSRFLSFFLGGFGVVGPIIAAICSDGDYKLMWSQFAVVALAIAGLLQFGDRVFGWSSGWLRYISTVTKMEHATRQFQLDWAAYFVELGKCVTPAEMRSAFEIAHRFECELSDLQTRETDGWIVEFNTGLVALNELVKTAREAADKSGSDARAAMKATATATAPGAIELTATTTVQPPPSVAVVLDGGSEEPCRGLTWGRLQVTPGLHQVMIRAFLNNAIASETVKIIEVPPGSTARVAVAI